MKQVINFSQFVDAFRQVERGNQFSYDGLKALYDYLEQLEDDCGTEIELDVIALCCEYSEYGDLEEFQANYGDEYENIDDIERQTAVIRFNADSFIIQNF